MAQVGCSELGLVVMSVVEVGSISILAGKCLCRVCWGGCFSSLSSILSACLVLPRSVYMITYSYVGNSSIDQLYTSQHLSGHSRAL